MLFSARFWSGLADGSITVAFRRQKRPTVKAGGTLRSPGGVLFIDSIDPSDAGDISDADLAASRHTRRDELLKMLKPDGQLYRIRFHLHGDDPRVALRDDADLTDADIADLRTKLSRLEWAAPVLRLIRDNEGVVSTALAPQVGMERLP